MVTAFLGALSGDLLCYQIGRLDGDAFLKKGPVGKSIWIKGLNFSASIRIGLSSATNFLWFKSGYSFNDWYGGLQCQTLRSSQCCWSCGMVGGCLGGRINMRASPFAAYSRHQKISTRDHAGFRTLGCGCFSLPVSEKSIELAICFLQLHGEISSVVSLSAKGREEAKLSAELQQTPG
jgi:hypothetical protein